MNTPTQMKEMTVMKKFNCFISCFLAVLILASFSSAMAVNADEFHTLEIEKNVLRRKIQAKDC